MSSERKDAESLSHNLSHLEKVKKLSESIRSDSKLNRRDLSSMIELNDIFDKDSEKDTLHKATYEALVGEIEQSLRNVYTVETPEDYENLQNSLLLISKVRGTSNTILSMSYNDFIKQADMDGWFSAYRMSSFVLKLSNDGRNLDLYPCHTRVTRDYRYATTLSMDTGRFNVDANKTGFWNNEKEEIDDNNQISFEQFQRVLDAAIRAGRSAIAKAQGEELRILEEQLKQTEIAASAANGRVEGALDVLRRQQQGIVINNAPVNTVTQTQSGVENTSSPSVTHDQSGRRQGSPKPRVGSDTGEVAPGIPQAPQAIPQNFQEALTRRDAIRDQIQRKETERREKNIRIQQLQGEITTLENSLTNPLSDEEKTRREAELQTKRDELARLTKERDDLSFEIDGLQVDLKNADNLLTDFLHTVNSPATDTADDSQDNTPPLASSSPSGQQDPGASNIPPDTENRRLPNTTGAIPSAGPNTQSAPSAPPPATRTTERPEILCNLDIGENYNRATWKEKADIILIQTILQKTVNPALEIDGVWGPITTQAVADFQYDNKNILQGKVLAIDGKIGGDTTAALNVIKVSNNITGHKLHWKYPGKSRNPQPNMPCNIRT